jgi:signal transduction histidine kinase
MGKETETETNMDIPNILIVDDIGANLKLLNGILIPEGYNIRQVTSGELALQVAENEKPDLILLDIMMPGMDGYEVCRRLKMNPELKDIPVLFISALSETNDIVKAFLAGGVDYINKPFHAEEVRARVSTHLKLHRQSRELRELNATKDKFFSIIAHDLRGPFSGFLGLTNILADKSESMTSGDIHFFSLAMKDSAANLFSLLENLLEWARLHRGVMTFEPKSILLMPMVSEKLRLVLDSANKKGIEIRYDIPAGLEVSADAYMLASIMRNLVSNAVKFTVKSGNIVIGAKKVPGNAVEISVRDTGIGMKPKMVDDLFRLDIKTNRQGTAEEPSSGLGLILCKDFVEKHGGRLWVESEEHIGSTFYFTFPNN